ncbi:mediator complex protein [Colletotrichum higginsianum]|nr:mediator complex protein [Colletotrichum higginsianum]
MADSAMTGAGAGAGATGEPFTLEERIQQLCEIDTSIVQLMHHTSSAMSALGAQKTPEINPEQQKQTFKSSMDALLSTLHTRDMEAELWAKMREFLERYHSQEQEASGEVSEMQQ